MQAVLEMPDNPVTQPNSMFRLMLTEQRMKQNIERQNLTVAINMITHLPTDAAPRAHDPNAFGDYSFMKSKVIFNPHFLFIFFP